MDIDTALDAFYNSKYKEKINKIPFGEESHGEPDLKPEEELNFHDPGESDIDKEIREYLRKNQK